jgi:hypothetical protein
VIELGVYKLTFGNSGGKKTIRSFNFDSDIKAINFSEMYNGFSNSAKVLKITHELAQYNERKIENLKNISYKASQDIDCKILYKTIKNEMYNCIIPFLPSDVTRSKIENLMFFVNDFADLVNITTKKII